MYEIFIAASCKCQAATLGQGCPALHRALHLHRARLSFSTGNALFASQWILWILPAFMLASASTYNKLNLLGSPDQQLLSPRVPPSASRGCGDRGLWESNSFGSMLPSACESVCEGPGLSVCSAVNEDCHSRK